MVLVSVFVVGVVVHGSVARPKIRTIAPVLDAIDMPAYI